MGRPPDSPTVAAPSARSVAAASAGSGPRELAEGEGFEPSRSLNGPYSLSRRAPSASRSSLRDDHCTGGSRALRQTLQVTCASRRSSVCSIALPGALGPARGDDVRRVNGSAFDQSYVSRTSRARLAVGLELVAPPVSAAQPAHEPRPGQAGRPRDPPAVLELHDLFVMAYGIPQRIDMPNFGAERQARRPLGRGRRLTVPDPSITGCCAGSASDVEDLLGRRGDLHAPPSTDVAWFSAHAPARVPFPVMDPAEALDADRDAARARRGAPPTRCRRSGGPPTPSATDARRRARRSCAKAGTPPGPARRRQQHGRVIARGARRARCRSTSRTSQAEAAPDAGPGGRSGAALRGDLHLALRLVRRRRRRSSRWPRAAAELGHEYMALTDHSPALKIAKGLTAERLRKQLDVVAEPQRGAGAVPHPHRHRGRHPRGRDARPGATTCSPSSTSSSPACTRSCACPRSR